MEGEIQLRTRHLQGGLENESCASARRKKLKRLEYEEHRYDAVKIRFRKRTVANTDSS